MRLWAGLLLLGQASLLMMLAFFLPDRSTPLDDSNLTPVSLPEVLAGKFAAKRPNVMWPAGDAGCLDLEQSYWVQDASGVWCVSDVAGVNQLVVNTTLIPFPVSSITFSNSGKQALITTEYTKIWRHSYTAKHYVIDVPYSGAQPVSIAPPALSPQRFATWSPATSGDAAGRIAFVFGCNLYVATNVGSTDNQQIIAITTDGQPGQSIGGVDSALCYGVPDWIYEEEVLGTADATWWSPDGQSLAFLRSNDADVTISHVSYESSDPTTTPYPRLLEYRMPKPGFANPTVTVLVYSFSQQQQPGAAAAPPVEVNIHSDVLFQAVQNDPRLAATSVPLGQPGNREADYIIGRVQWGADSKLIVRVFNRVQNHEQVVVFDKDTASSTVVLQRSSQTGWLEFEPAFVFLPPTTTTPTSATTPATTTTSSFVCVEDVNGNNHLVLYTLDSTWGSVTRVGALTSGNWGVIGVAGYSKAMSSLIFTTTQDGPTRSTIAAVSVSSSTTASSLPSLAVTTLFNHGYMTLSLSTSGQLAVVSYNGPAIPTHSLYRLTSSAPELVRPLELNKALNTTLTKYAMPVKRYFKINVDSNRVLDAYAIVPYTFDDSGAKKYPILFKVYGGPGSQGVTETYGVSFDQYVASLGIIVVECDGRGSAGRDLAWKHATYMNLGDYEPKDRIDAAIALGQSAPWVDTKRMSIWGWSYGGYVTSRVAGIDTSDVFRVKMAVAPVTDWRFYDTIYTERYMGLPADNPNYFNSSVLHLANNFDDSFLLVHGLADDNVQYINSAALEEKLIAGNKHFTTRFYPNRDHGITGGFTRENLYGYLVGHLERYLLP